MIFNINNPVVLETYYVNYDHIYFLITGHEEDTTGHVAVLAGDTVEITFKGASPARPGRPAPTYTINVGSTQGASDIATLTGLSINDKVRTFVMPACDVYLSYVRE